MLPNAEFSDIMEQDWPRAFREVEPVKGRYPYRTWPQLQVLWPSLDCTTYLEPMKEYRGPRCPIFLYFVIVLYYPLFW